MGKEERRSGEERVSEKRKSKTEVEVEATARAGAQPVAMNNVNAVKNVNRSLSLGVRPTRGAAGRLNGVRTHVNKSLVSSSARPSLKKAVGSRDVVAPKSMINELALLAEVPESQVNEIFKTAGVLFGITLVGLALGFVLLRVESFVESSNSNSE